MQTHCLHALTPSPPLPSTLNALTLNAIALNVIAQRPYPGPLPLLTARMTRTPSRSYPVHRHRPRPRTRPCPQCPRRQRHDYRRRPQSNCGRAARANALRSHAFAIVPSVLAHPPRLQVHTFLSRCPKKRVLFECEIVQCREVVRVEGLCQNKCLGLAYPFSCSVHNVQILATLSEKKPKKSSWFQVELLRLRSLSAGIFGTASLHT